MYPDSPPTLRTSPNTHYDFILGASAKLVVPCVATGSPTPTITFYRNNELLTSGAVGSVVYTVNNGSTSGELAITLPTLGSTVSPDVRNQINGWYTCMAANIAGSVTADFSVTVACKFSY